MHKVLIPALALLYLGIGGTAFGRDEQLNQFFDDWRWVRFNSTSGLPSNSVLTVADDSEGITWAGTEAGLAWFDGYSWHTVGPESGLKCREQVKSIWVLEGAKLGHFRLLRNFR